MTPTPDQQQRDPSPIQSVGAPPETVRENDKIMLVLCYMGILGLIPLLTVKDSEFVKWHAKQGLVWSVGAGMALVVVATILGFIPFIGWLVSCVAWLGYLAVDVMAMVKAMQGNRWRIPVAADLAEKLPL